MADVFPFAGTRYQLKEGKQQDLGSLFCPPFDIITPDLRKRLHEASDLNLVRLIAGFDAPSDDEQNNRFSRAAECYRDWKNKQTLQDEQRKCFYVYEQEYKLPGMRKPVKRTGFISLVKLQDYRSGKIRAHEETLRTLRNEQLRLLKSVQVNLTPPFMLYKDPENEVTKILTEAIEGKGRDSNGPAVEAKDIDGTTHRLWLIHRKEPILAVHEALKPKRLYIADGHHIYDAALAYRDEMREATGRRDGRQPYDHMMMYLHNADDDKLTLLPVHRILARELGADVEIEEVLEDVREYFTAKEFKLDMDNLKKAAATIQEKFDAATDERPRFAMVLPTGRSFLLTLRKDADVHEMIEEETMSEELKSLDVTILHNYLITRGWIGNPEVELGEDDIYYRRDSEEALDLLKRRRGSVAFIVQPRKLSEVLTIAENGELMPPYSTFFTPKLGCGLVMRDLQVGFG
jgi:uncharacterized protein (DUF1015 family)